MALGCRAGPVGRLPAPWLRQAGGRKGPDAQLSWAPPGGSCGALLTLCSDWAGILWGPETLVVTAWCLG